MVSPACLLSKLYPFVLLHTEHRFHQGTYQRSPLSRALIPWWPLLKEQVSTSFEKPELLLYYIDSSKQLHHKMIGPFRWSETAGEAMD